MKNDTYEIHPIFAKFVILEKRGNPVSCGMSFICKI